VSRLLATTSIRSSYKRQHASLAATFGHWNPPVCSSICSDTCCNFDHAMAHRRSKARVVQTRYDRAWCSFWLRSQCVTRSHWLKEWQSKYGVLHLLRTVQGFATCSRLSSSSGTICKVCHILVRNPTVSISSFSRKYITVRQKEKTAARTPDSLKGIIAVGFSESTSKQDDRAASLLAPDEDMFLPTTAFNVGS
jgi:hypothetical protein